MSAREQLAEQLRNPGLVGLDEEDAAELINAFAHELAEQQRTEMRAPGRSYDASRWNRCIDMTADLIDPTSTDTARSDEETAT